MVDSDHNDAYAVGKTYPLNCTCDASAECVRRSAFFVDSDVDNPFLVPGFYLGCYVIEALLQSSLECFFSTSCIKKIQSYYLPTTPMRVTALNASLLKEYFINSTVKQLLDKLMIEEWNLTSLYDRYYNECQPSQCKYSIETKNGLIYIITTLIGIVGGLVTALKLIAPRVVKLVMYCIQKRRVRVGQIPNIEG